MTEEASLSVAENFYAEFKTSALPELSGSFSIDFKRSRIRPRVIKINTFKLETSICNHFPDAQVCVSFVFFSLSDKIYLLDETLILYFCAGFFGLGLNIYGAFG